MRSGTTLFRAMLAQHSAITSGLETHWFDIDWPNQQARGGEPLKTYLHRIGEYFNISVDQVDELIDRANGAEFFLNLFMNTVARRDGKRRWAEKTTGNILHLNRILAYWPGAKIIHVIRDPRDVFASFRRSKKYGGVTDYANLWCDYLGQAERFKVELPLIADTYFEVRYEALVANPVVQMRQVLEFLDEEWEEAISRFAGEAEEHNLVQKLTGHSSTTLLQIAKPLSQDRVGLGQQGITDAEMKTVRGVVAARGLSDLFTQIATT